MSKFQDLAARRMIPEIDAFPFEEQQIADLGQDWKEQVYPWALRACDVLKPQFGDALLLHKIPDLIKALIPSLDLAPVCARAGLVYASLDFFHARQCPPSARNLRRRETAQELPGYIRNRAFDFVTMNSARIVAWLAVLKGIPAQWVPIAKISRRLQARIRTAIEPAQLEVALDLRVPPGGKAWLRRESLTQFSVLHENRPDRDPKAAALLIECPDQIEILPVVVVQSSANASHGLIKFFDPFFPLDVRSIHLDLQSGDLKFSAPSARNICGLMAMSFQPRAPAVSGFQALLAAFHVAPMAWYLSRLWRLAAFRR